MFVLVRLTGLCLLPRLRSPVALMRLAGLCLRSVRMRTRMRLAGLCLLARLRSPVVLMRLAGLCLAARLCFAVARMRLAGPG